MVISYAEFLLLNYRSGALTKGNVDYTMLIRYLEGNFIHRLIISEYVMKTRGLASG